MNNARKTGQVVKIVTSAWRDTRGLHVRRDVFFVKRASTIDVLTEDALSTGALSVIRNIDGFNDCPDGVYELAISVFLDDNGDVDDYRYNLVPWKGGGA